MAVDARRVKELFVAALDLADPPARGAFLDRECAADADLRHRLEVLLRAHDHPESALERPLAAPAATGSFAPGEPTGDHGPSETAGSLVAGRYKLLERIGEGGMGEVWVADQSEPIKRRVAVKLIKAGMDSKAVLARFEAERQALALMDHPNIAKVLDAGSTEDGRPYFVMELVKGTPITQFCDARKLSPRERLELFIPVCQAIQHAHQKGIIHRDIKPTNVLVALHDEKAVPKVIDFGVAKAVGQQLTEKTLYTGFGSLIGTPAYMAPEQATFNQLDIDTRADVYALGVLLYELLAGSPPFELERLQKVALDEVLRLVREEEPPRPSARLSTSQSKASISAVRQTDPSKLATLMRGELDWIVMKALDKDRSRRYETATGFAADVRRYLAGEPVLAVPPSVGYRLRKFVRRNRGPVVAAACVLVAIVGGLIGATFGVVESQKQREVVSLLQQTEQARQDAETARDQLGREKHQTELGRETLSRVEYARSVDLAHREYLANNIGRAQELLDACRGDLRGWEWRYVDRLMNGNLRTLRHESRVTAVAANADGSRVVTGETNSAVRLWDSVTGQQVQNFKGHTGGNGYAVETVVFNRDGTLILTASMDETARVWDAATGKELLKLPHEEVVYSAVFSPDETRIATTCQDRVARIWDAKSGKLLTENTQYKKLYGPISFHPDGARVLTIDGDQAVRVWDAASGAELSSVPLGDYPRAAAFSPDGKRIVCALADKTVAVFDAASGKRLVRLEKHWDDIQALAVSPDGARIATGSRDRTVRIWDTKTGAELAVLRGHPAPINAVAFSRDGSRIVTGSDDGTARVWDAKALPGSNILRPAVGVMALAPSEDAEAVAVGGTSGEMQVWNLRTRDKRWGNRHGFGWVTSVAFSPDGRNVASAGEDWAVRVWDARTGTAVHSLEGHTLGVESVAYHPKGKVLVSGGLDNSARVWDAATGKPVRTLEHPGPVWTVVFNPDGSLLATGAWDDQIRLWDTTTWELVRTYRNPDQMVRALQFNRDGTRLAARGQGGAVTIWDAKTHQVIRTLPCPREDGVSMAFSPDGSRVVTSGKDANVHVWDAQSGVESISPAVTELSINLNLNPATRYPLAFTRDGNTLLTGSFDQSIRVWEAGPIDREGKR
jgi:eukaryotic-like serine/threonine-protein kinase